MKKSKNIRSAVRPEGMLIYAEDIKQVCIANNITDDSYTIINRPTFKVSYEWNILDELNFIDHRTTKEEIFFLIRYLLEVVLSIFIPNVMLRGIIEERQRIALYFIMLAMTFIFEFAIMRGLKRQKTNKVKTIYKYRGALNKALNSYEKSGIINFDNVKKASIYRVNAGSCIEPSEFVGVIFLVIGISFLLPPLVQICLIPLFIILSVVAVKTSLFGLLRVTSVMQPDEYEIKMACDLLNHWKEISYSKTPKTN